MKEVSPKISVIIPVYKVEKYIERCAQSLFKQTLDGIEFIFVDDCTPDGSMEVLGEIIEKKRPLFAEMNWEVRTVRMASNSGQAAVRSHGIQLAKGQFVIHCDSDDWIEPDMYKTMYDTAIAEEADVVVCDFTRTDGIKKKTEQGCHSTNLVKFKENCLFQRDHWSLCNKLFAKTCYRDIVYPDGALGEDMMICVQLLNNCKKLAYVNQSFYNYYFNPDSITKKKTVENCSRNYHLLKSNTDFTIDYIKRYYEVSIDKDLASRYLRMVNHFSLLPIKHIPEYGDLWRKHFPVMPLRYFFNCRFGYYNKVVYILALLHLYPRKSDRAI